MHRHSTRIYYMQGFSLLEVLIASTIAMSTVIFGIYWLKFNAYIDQGRSVGQQYITLNDAVNNYLVTHSQALARINTACSETTFALVRPLRMSEQRQSVNCTLSVAQGKTVANAFQPTASELFNLGFLPKSPAHASGYLQIEIPNTKHDNFSGLYVTEADPDFPNGNEKEIYPATAFRLFINIELTCLQRGTANTPNTSPAPSSAPAPEGCPSDTTTAFKSLIFNTQRYVEKSKGNNFGSPALFASIVEKIGSDALSSGLNVTNVTNLGELFGKNFTIINPIRVVDTTLIPNTNVGLGGIVAMRGGYGASYAMQHSRTDGSNPPTADWDFGAYSLNNLNKITSTSGQIDTLSTKSAMNIPSKVTGNSCNPSTESIATAQDADQRTDLLVCKNGFWTKISTSGTVDFTKYKEFNFTASTAQIFDCPILNTCTPIKPDPTVSTNQTNHTRTLTTSMATKSYFPVVMHYESKSDQSSLTGEISGYSINSANTEYTVVAKNITDFNLTIRFYPINP